jgi:hypothetical protein
MTTQMNRQRQLLTAQAYLLRAMDELDHPDHGNAECSEIVMDAYIALAQSIDSRIEHNPYFDALTRGRPLSTADGQLEELFVEMEIA